MAIDFRIITPRIFTDERLHPLDSDHKWTYAYCVGGLHSCNLTQTGIYRIGRGEINFHTNVGMEKTEKIIAFFNQKLPELMEYDNKTHMISVKSLFKYMIRHDFLKVGLPVVKAVHKDFKRYSQKAPKFFADFSHMYHDILDDSIRSVSTKDNNYPLYRKTFDDLFALEALFFPDELKPKSEIKEVSAKRMREDLANLFPKM